MKYLTELEARILAQANEVQKPGMDTSAQTPRRTELKMPDLQLPLPVQARRRPQPLLLGPRKETSFLRPDTPPGYWGLATQQLGLDMGHEEEEGTVFSVKAIKTGGGEIRVARPSTAGRRGPQRRAGKPWAARGGRARIPVPLTARPRAAASRPHPWRRAHPSLRSGSDRLPGAATVLLTRPCETILPMGHGGRSAEPGRPARKPADRRCPPRRRPSADSAG